MSTSKKPEAITVGKEDFIDFLAQATPEDLNELIRTRGKRKLYSPFYIFKDNHEKKEENNDGNNSDADCQHQEQPGSGQCVSQG